MLEDRTYALWTKGSNLMPSVLSVLSSNSAWRTLFSILWRSTNKYHPKKKGIEPNTLRHMFLFLAWWIQISPRPTSGAGLIRHSVLHLHLALWVSLVEKTFIASVRVKRSIPVEFPHHRSLGCSSHLTKNEENNGKQNNKQTRNALSSKEQRIFFLSENWKLFIPICRIQPT